jgi:hypothetical protein
MSEWIKRLIGKKEKEQVEENVKTAEELRREALEAEKELATKNGEAWVAVLDTQVNPENIRNGFFELDWNNEFIEQLLDAGYKGESQEEIVDAWFRTIVMQMLDEEGLDNSREIGYINTSKIGKGKSEVS